jgi:phosphate starvation-inducible PhoH-like protein
MGQHTQHWNRDLIPHPRNDGQKRSEELFPDKDWLFLIGPAGTGKTHQAIKMAMSAIMGDIKLPFRPRRVVLTRPAVEAGPPLGFMPGSLEDKMGPWLKPVEDVLSKMTWTKPAEVMADFFEIVAFSHMRGRTFDDCVVVIDEAQNCPWELLELAFTRLGERGRMIFCGSVDQSDLPRRYQALGPFVDSVREVSSCGVIEFDPTQILRNPRMAEALAAIKNGKEKWILEKNAKNG